MPVFKVNNKPYEVPEDEAGAFLKQYPNAQKISDSYGVMNPNPPVPPHPTKVAGYNEKGQIMFANPGFINAPKGRIVRVRKHQNQRNPNPNNQNQKEEDIGNKLVDYNTAINQDYNIKRNPAATQQQKQQFDKETTDAYRPTSLPAPDDVLETPEAQQILDRMKKEVKSTETVPGAGLEGAPQTREVTAMENTPEQIANVKDFFTNNPDARKLYNNYKTFKNSLSNQIPKLIDQAEGIKIDEQNADLKPYQGYQNPWTNYAESMQAQSSMMDRDPLMDQSVKVLKETQDILKNGGKEGLGGFIKGLSSVSSEKLQEFFTPFLDLARSKAMGAIISKYQKDPNSLTPRERLALQAKAVSDQLMAYLHPSAWYNSGKSMQEMAKWVRDYFASGMILNPLTSAIAKGAEGLFSAVKAGSLLTKGLEAEKAASLAAKGIGVSKYLDNAIKTVALPIMQTGIHPTSLTAISDATQGRAGFNDKGNVVISDQVPEEQAQRSEYINNLTQALAGYVLPNMPKPVSSLLGLNGETEFGKAFQKIANKFEISGWGNQAKAQYLGQIGHVLNGDMPWQQLFDLRANGQMVLQTGVAMIPFAATAAAGMAIGKVRDVNTKRKVYTNYTNAQTSMRQAFGANADEAINELNDLINKASDKDATTLFNKVAQSKDYNPEQKKATMDYLMSRSLYSGILKANDEHAQKVADKVKKEVVDSSNKEQGIVQTVKVQGIDEPVPLVKGNVKFDENGNVDLKNSDKVVYIKQGDKTLPISPEKIEREDESMPTEEAVKEAEVKTKEKVNQQLQNEDVPEYQNGDLVTVRWPNGKDYSRGSIIRKNPDGTYAFLDTYATEPYDIQPTQIVNEDNVKNLHNGSIIQYYDQDGNVKTGEIDDFESDKRRQGKIGVDGTFVPVRDVIGEVDETQQNEPDNAQSVAGEQRQTEENTPNTNQNDIQNQAQANTNPENNPTATENQNQSSVQETKKPVEEQPKGGNNTYEIEKGITATEQGDNTYLLNKTFSKSEKTKADDLVKRLNKDYEDNGIQFEVTPLPKKDPNNVFEKPKFGIKATIDKSGEIGGNEALQTEAPKQNETANKDANSNDNSPKEPVPSDGGQGKDNSVQGDNSKLENRTDQNSDVLTGIPSKREQEKSQKELDTLKHHQDTADKLHTENKGSAETRVILDNEDFLETLERDGADEEIVNTAKELQGSNEFDLSAAYVPSIDKIYLRSDAAKDDAEFNSNWLHENVHRAIDKLLGDNKEEFLTAFYDRMGKEAIEQYVPKAYFDQSSDKDVLANEYIAHFAEDLMKGRNLFSYLRKGDFSDIPDNVEVFRILKDVFNYIRDGKIQSKAMGQHDVSGDSKDTGNGSSKGSEGRRSENTNENITPKRESDGDGEGPKQAVRGNEQQVPGENEEPNSGGTERTNGEGKSGTERKQSATKRLTSIPKEKFDHLVNRLKKSGLAKDVITDKDKYDEKLKEAHTDLKDNGTVYGFTTPDGTVYLDPNKMNANTPVHEFGHLWNSFIKEHNKPLYEQGKKLIKDSPYWDKVNSNPAYKDLPEDAKVDEALAMAIGDKGEMVVNSKWEAIKSWARRALTWVKNKLGYDNMSLNDFTDRAVGDVLGGKELDKSQPETLSKQELPETEDIKQRAVNDGTFMKAPNGKKSNLDEKQWLQTRTSNFKNWFGDWEKAARIDKLLKSKPIEITGKEITPSDDLRQYKKNALEYGKNLRGEYTNKDTGESILLSAGTRRGGIREILQHDYKDVEHLQSIAAIPKIIENSIYIDTVKNENKEKNPDIASYDYYVTGLRIGGVDYTVKAVVANGVNGERYYDHRLTQIEKIKLLSSFPKIQKLGEESSNNKSALSDIKDKRLLSILQNNSSKVVDENGEPMVVYHGTNSTDPFWEFKHKGSDSQGSYLADDQQAFFFANKDVAELYSGKLPLMPVFLDIKNPDIIDVESAINETLSGEDYTKEEAEDAGYPISRWEGLGNESMEANDSATAYFDDNAQEIFQDAKDNKSDGVVVKGVDGSQTVLAFDPDQIKSATDNTGEFNPNNNDIRFQTESTEDNGTKDNGTKEKYGEYPEDPAEKEEGLDEHLPTFYEKRLGRQLTETITNVFGKEQAPKIMEFIDKTSEFMNDSAYPWRQLYSNLLQNGKKISDDEDAYEVWTAVPGKNQHDEEMVSKHIIKPITDGIHELIKTGISARDWDSYLFFKSGLEKKALNDKREMDKFLKENPKATPEEIQKFKESLPQSFKGVKDIEKEVGMPAEEYVKKIEDKLGKEKTNKLWADWTKASDYNLKKQLDTGMINYDTYKYYKEAKFYVPGRGFDDPTASDFYYYGSKADGENSYNPTNIKEHGRKSRPDKPLPNLKSIISSTIEKGNKNATVGLRILRLAESGKTNGLLTADKVWYTKGVDNEGNPEFKIRSPQHSSDPQEDRLLAEKFDKEMQDLKAKGEAFQSSSKLNLHGMFATPDQVDEHRIPVWRNGVQYAVWVNGDPSLAEAYNGTNFSRRKQLSSLEKFYKDKFEGLNNFLSHFGKRSMANMYTTASPAFILRNGTRDLEHAISTGFVKKGPEYVKKMTENYFAHSLPALMGYFNKKTDLSDKYGRYLYEYMANGAKTGFSQLFELRDIQREMDRMIKHGDKKNIAKVVINAVAAANEFIENAPRFATYITSREMGRSVPRSVLDAKEITVNFNRRGAGRTWLNTWYMFANAGIQSMAGTVMQGLSDPKRLAKLASVAFTYGLTTAVFAPGFAYLIGGQQGLDDYEHLSDYQRQNFWNIYTGNGFVSIPIAQIYRIPASWGDTAYMLGRGKIDTQQAAGNIFTSFDDMLPINAMGSAINHTQDVQPDNEAPNNRLADWISILAPSVAQPIAEAVANRSFTGAPITNKWANWNYPGYTLVKTNRNGVSYVPDLVVGLSKVVNKATGGDDVTPGHIEDNFIGKALSNPDISNHLLSGYFGGVYGTAMALLGGGEAIYKAVNGEKTNYSIKSTPLSSWYTSVDDLNPIPGYINDPYREAINKATADRDHYKKYDTNKTGLLTDYNNHKIGKQAFDEKTNEYNKRQSQINIERAHNILNIQRRVGKLYKERQVEPDPNEQKDLDNQMVNLAKQVIDINKEPSVK